MQPVQTHIQFFSVTRTHMSMSMYMYVSQNTGLKKQEKCYQEPEQNTLKL